MFFLSILIKCVCVPPVNPGTQLREQSCVSVLGSNLFETRPLLIIALCVIQATSSGASGVLLSLFSIKPKENWDYSMCYCTQVQGI